MSKLISGLFSFDGPLYKDVNGIYCNSYITDEMLERYLNVVDELTIIIRVFNIKKTYQEENLQPLKTSKIKIIETPNFNSPKGMIIDSIKWKKRISEVVAQSDLIFCRMPSIISDIVASQANKQGKNYLVEVGGCAWDSYWNHSILGKIVAPKMYLSEKKSVANASHASYVTKQWLQKRYPNFGEQIVASNVNIPKTDSEILESKLVSYSNKTRKSHYTIGTIANVDVRYKGQEYIIKSIASLIKSGFNIDYELVGGGDQFYLKKIAVQYGISDHVHFKGRLLHNEVLSWLDTIDIYSQPSKQEGLPRSVIEAMNRACICIGSTTAGIPELLTEELIFDNGAVSQISEIIRMIMESDFEYKKSIATRNFYESDFYNKENLKKIRDLFFSKYRDSVLSTSTT
ncbi:glycosyltransferase family 4 protein [Streptococcus pluranimalium]|uniref:glycosyltransferase family 4 protein n=1 Tax=Streptococcus pluranimalium TaxID=82348 RepID=UPI003139A77B